MRLGAPGWRVVFVSILLCLVADAVILGPLALTLGSLRANPQVLTVIVSFAPPAIQLVVVFVASITIARAAERNGVVRAAWGGFIIAFVLTGLAYAATVLMARRAAVSVSWLNGILYGVAMVLTLSLIQTGIAAIGGVLGARMSGTSVQ
jgi:hypothetical protein